MTTQDKVIYSIIHIAINLTAYVLITKHFHIPPASYLAGWLAIVSANAACERLK